MVLLTKNVDNEKKSLINDERAADARIVQCLQQ